MVGQLLSGVGSHGRSVAGVSESETNRSRLGAALVPDQNPSRPMPPDWDTYVEQVLTRWKRLLDSGPAEGEVQRFLELNPSMIPGGSGDVGPGGHHRSEMRAVFRCPTLKGAGRSFAPDFMWVTRSTSLITPILIEIEKPSKRWFGPKGRPTADFTQAHDQLNDWRSWFAQDENRALFRRDFLFHDRYDDRPLEPQFVLIYGRASEFAAAGGHDNPRELRHKRDTMRTADESFMTFDSLAPRYDHSDTLTITMTAHGPRVFAVSPHYTTGTDVGPDAVRLGNISAALGRSRGMSEQRKQYINARWKYWAAIEREEVAKGYSSRIRTMGRE
jgi:hypothetical protein